MEARWGPSFHYFLVLFSPHQSQRKTDTPMQCHEFQPILANPLLLLLSLIVLYLTPGKFQSRGKASPTQHPLFAGVLSSQWRLCKGNWLQTWRWSHWDSSFTWPAGEGWHLGSVAGVSSLSTVTVGSATVCMRANVCGVLLPKKEKIPCDLDLELHLCTFPSMQCVN